LASCGGFEPFEGRGITSRGIAKQAADHGLWVAERFLETVDMGGGQVE